MVKSQHLKGYSREGNDTSTVPSTSHVNTLHSAMPQTSTSDRRMGVRLKYYTAEASGEHGLLRAAKQRPLPVSCLSHPNTWEHRTSELSLSHFAPPPHTEPVQSAQLKPEFPLLPLSLLPSKHYTSSENAKYQCCRNPKRNINRDSPSHLEVFIWGLTKELMKPQEWLPSPCRQEPGILFFLSCSGSQGFCKNAVT